MARCGPPVGDRTALPTLRSDAADRLLGRHRAVTWPLAFLHLVAESARMAARELDRLEAAAGQGRGLAAGLTPQTATAALSALQRRGLVKELTGGRRFRAFTV